LGVTPVCLKFCMTGRIDLSTSVNDRSGPGNKGIFTIDI
jgi:hypothetical protein